MARIATPLNTSSWYFVLVVWLIRASLAVPQAFQSIKPEDRAVAGLPVSWIFNHTFDQSELGVRIIPGDFTIVPTWYDVKLDYIDAYETALTALLKLALNDPRDGLGPTTFRAKTVAIHVQTAPGQTSMASLFAVFGIYEAIYELAQSLKWVEADFTMRGRGVHVGTISFRRPLASNETSQYPLDSVENDSVLYSPVNQSLPFPIGINRSKRQAHEPFPDNAVDPLTLKPLVVATWSGRRIPNWDFYLALNTMAAKIARIDGQYMKVPVDDIDILHDTPSYRLSITDLTHSPGPSFFNPVHALEMCKAAFLAGQAKSTKEELDLQFAWRNDRGEERARWKLELQDSTSQATNQNNPSQEQATLHDPSTSFNRITTL